jgi:hypothetical protein
MDLKQNLALRTTKECVIAIPTIDVIFYSVIMLSIMEAYHGENPNSTDRGTSQEGEENSRS